MCDSNSVADQDPGSSVFLTLDPVSGMGKGLDTTLLG